MVFDLEEETKIWLPVSFMIGFAAGFFFRSSFDYIIRHFQENPDGWKRYIPNFNIFDKFNSQPPNLYSQGVISNPSAQNKSLKDRGKKKITSEGQPQNLYSQGVISNPSGQPQNLYSQGVISNPSGQPQNLYSQGVISNPSAQNKSLKNRGKKKITSEGQLQNLYSQGMISNPSGQLQNSSSSFSTVSQDNYASYQTRSRSSYQNKIPAKLDPLLQNPNLAFYQNKIPAKPNRECIEEILKKWSGNYRILQENRTYIQWLFPNRDPGTNAEAHVLNDEEAIMIQDLPELRDRLRRAFEMMLDFYGMRLTQNNQIQLAENSNERLKQLNQKDNRHFLCITRILLALKEFGHNHLMLPFIECLGKLIYQGKKLNHAKSSFEKFWITTLDPADRMKLMPYDTPKFHGNSRP